MRAYRLVGQFQPEMELQVMKHEPFAFVRITSDYGWIGNICWLNSSTMPTFNIAWQQLTRRWGGFSTSWPEAGCMIAHSDEVFEESGNT
jgi:hypothetical protein